MPVALIPAALSAGVGLYQTLFSGRKRAERKLERAVDNAPTYGGNKGINDYYTEAYNRYLTSPENSALYQNAVTNINRGTANTLSNLQDRRAALDAAGQLEASQNAGYVNAALNAENQRNQRFGILGNATQMKAADDMQKFQTNTLMPYQSKLSLLSTKASTKNQQFNMGLSNIGNAAGATAMYFGGGGKWGDNNIFNGSNNGGGSNYQPYSYDPNIVRGSYYGGYQ